MTVGDLRKQLEGMPDEMPVVLRMENDPPDNLSVEFHGFILRQHGAGSDCEMIVSIDNSDDVTDWEDEDDDD